MKIQLDYNNKEISLDNGVNLKEFYDRIKTLLPDWKEWSLSPNSLTYWQPPVYIPYVQPDKPWWEYQPYTFDINTTTETYCLQVN